MIDVALALAQLIHLKDAENKDIFWGTNEKDVACLFDLI